MHNKPLELRTQQVGPYSMNTYALVDPESNSSVLFDPGAEPQKLNAMLGDSRPLAIILTHTHIDHVMALDDMREQLDVPVYGHPGPHQNGEEVALDKLLEHGDHFEFAGHQLRVEYAPGHIGNQICLLVEADNRAIVGDTLFEGGPGRTWSPDGFQQTLDTLRNVVLRWPDDTVCYPGHGPSFRLGDVRSQIEAFLAKDHGDFYGDATWDM